MINYGKKNVIGILVSAMDYEAAVAEIATAALESRSLPVSCAAVHTIMEGALDEEQKYRMNRLGMVLPDGMPVRWALRILHGIKLPDRVYGTTLTLRVLARAEQEGLGVYFYGNTSDILDLLRRNLRQQFPALRICGMEPSQFRRLNATEKNSATQRIRESGASLLFTGLGTPLQDVWAYEYAEVLPMPVLCIGGSFNVLAGRAAQAPPWMQSRGLEWLFRLSREPRRLWRRYLLLNPWYAWMVARQKLGQSFASDGRRPTTEMYYG
jgi:N-acetylglucosaminyldiphosphoundecaprenol N-acetyl-beta-D-mannosaminyltransferase